MNRIRRKDVVMCLADSEGERIAGTEEEVSIIYNNEVITEKEVDYLIQNDMFKYDERVIATTRKQADYLKQRKSVITKSIITRKVFTAEIIYGDADTIETVSYITDNPNEIELVTFFLDNYTEDLFEFYTRPDLLKYRDDFLDKRKKYIAIINKLAKLLRNIKDEYEVEFVEENSDEKNIHKAFVKCLDFIRYICNWSLQNRDEPGSIGHYSVKDITGKKVISKEEAVRMLEEFGENVYIYG